MIGLPCLPGFRFHPTGVELLLFYLKRKILGKSVHDVIGEVDIYGFTPDELPEKSLLKSGDQEWYFFCRRDLKYSNGLRTNRSTDYGYWKATGNDKDIYHDSRLIGKRKTLIFHDRRMQTGPRTNWVIYEYRLEDPQLADSNISQEKIVLCKLFKKSGPGPKLGEDYGAIFDEKKWDDYDENMVESLHPPLSSPSVDGWEDMDASVHQVQSQQQQTGFSKTNYKEISSYEDISVSESSLQGRDEHRSYYSQPDSLSTILFNMLGGSQSCPVTPLPWRDTHPSSDLQDSMDMPASTTLHGGYGVPVPLFYESTMLQNLADDAPVSSMHAYLPGESRNEILPWQKTDAIISEEEFLLNLSSMEADDSEMSPFPGSYLDTSGYENHPHPLFPPSSPAAASTSYDQSGSYSWQTASEICRTNNCPADEQNATPYSQPSTFQGVFYR